MHGHRKPTRTDVITGYRCDALLEAATRVFGKHGFDGATMEQIAREADVAKGTTYLYYASKQSIYDAALSRGLAELDEWTRQALQRAPNLQDAIAAFVTARAQYFFEHRDFFRMYVAAIARQITSVKPRTSEFQAMVDRQTRRLEAAIARGVARGEIRQVDAAATTLAIFDLTRGLVARGIVATRTFDVEREAAFVTALVWRGLEKGKGTREKGQGRLKGKRQTKMRRRIAGVIAAMLAVGSTVSAQTGEGQTGTTSPFFGSATQGTVSATSINLSVKDAVDRALQFNLGLLLQAEEAKAAHGARWRALAGLLPDISTGITTSRQIINLEAYGFQADPSVIGPFNVFDARVYASQPLLDLRALNDARAASANERAQTLGIRSARDLVTLVAVNLYLEAVAAASRVEATRAQQATAEALSMQAADMKQAGVVAGIDLLRAQVQVQNQRRRTIRAESDFEKSKLQLARAIGLPPAQSFTLTDKIPYAPLAEVTLDSALKTAFESRADYLAARERVAAAEASRRAAASDHIPTVHLDADYGALGQTVSGSHETYRVAATVTLPVFDGGRSTARRIETASDLRRRQAELDDIRGRVEYDVRTALLDVRAAAQQLEAAQANVTLAGQELEQARDRFAAGVAGNIEVTQAQESVAVASESYIDALYAHNLAKASLARAVGTAEQSVKAFIEGIK